MKQVPCWVTTNTRCHCTKLSFQATWRQNFCTPYKNRWQINVFLILLLSLKDLTSFSRIINSGFLIIMHSFKAPKESKFHIYSNWLHGCSQKNTDVKLCGTSKQIILHKHDTKQSKTHKEAISNSTKCLLQLYSSSLLCTKSLKLQVRTSQKKSTGKYFHKVSYIASNVYVNICPFIYILSVTLCKETYLLNISLHRN
jgi:hypothetical protein